jgi:hypothetical protein
MSSLQVRRGWDAFIMPGGRLVPSLLLVCFAVNDVQYENYKNLNSFVPRFGLYNYRIVVLKHAELAKI